MLDASKQEPLYHQLYLLLQQQITHHELKTGEKLPSERKLAALYGISRMTVRRALNQLVQDGWIGARHGKGYFVSHRPMWRIYLQQSQNFSRKRRQKQTSSRWLDADVINTESHTSQHLQYFTAKQLMRMRWLHFVDTIAVAVEVCYIPYVQETDNVTINLKKQSSEDTAISDPVDEHMRVQHAVTAALATQEEAELLSLTQPAALLHLQCTHYDARGHATRYTYIAYRGDLYQLNL